MRIRVGLFILSSVFLITLLNLQHAFAAAPPYPPSTVIQGIAWDPASTVVRKAPGSDNWPTTWGADDNIYTSWGDGGGFGGTNSDGRVSLGVARIEGLPKQFNGVNVWGGKNPESPATFGGKSYGILSVNGILYMWVGPRSNWNNATETKLAWSNDNGRTWQLSEIFFRYTNGFSLPTFLNFGKDYSGSRDNFVYIYAFDGSKGSSGPFTKINLARVDKDQIKNRAAYDFFKGLDINGNPLWTSDVAERVPVFSDPSGGVLMPSVIYNSALGRYLLAVTHKSDNPGGWIENKGGLGIFDAPEPWGPWTTVEYTDNWMGGNRIFYACIPTKWISTDGKTFYLIFTGAGSDIIAKDNYQHIRGVFSISGSSTDTIPPTIISVRIDDDPTKVIVTFNEPLEETSATNSSNYRIGNGITISEASLNPDLKTVTLTTSAHGYGITYTLSVSNIADKAQPPNVIAPNATYDYTFTAQLVISNLFVGSGKQYGIIEKELLTGALVYIDRSYTFTSAPVWMENVTYIKTANNDKGSSGDSFISFDVNQNVTVFVAHDHRATSKPSWMGTFADTGNFLITTDTTLDIFAKDFSAGAVILGGNDEAASMYSVIIMKQGIGQTPGNPPPSAPTGLKIISEN